MQEWNSREISTAVQPGTRAHKSNDIDKLQLLLTEVEKTCPTVVKGAISGTLCCIDKLAIYNAHEVEGVWIATGRLKQIGDLPPSHVEGSGYTRIESMVSLLHEISIVRALWVLRERTEIPFVEESNHPVLIDYSQELLGKLPQQVGANNDVLPVRHLANRVKATFPKVLYLQVMSGVLPMLTEGCAAGLRQRDAIAAAVCNKVEMHAFALWRSRKLPSRKSSPELKSLFAYYCKRCLPVNKRDNELLLDISTDWGPSVYAALSFHADSGFVVVATGCGNSAHVGIAKAVCNLRQKESNLFAALQKKQLQGLGELSARDHKILRDTQAYAKNIKQLSNTERDPLRERFRPERTFVREVARQAESAGVDLFYSDITPPASPLSVVKVISPQLLTTASSF